MWDRRIFSGWMIVNFLLIIVYNILKLQGNPPLFQAVSNMVTKCCKF